MGIGSLSGRRKARRMRPCLPEAVLPVSRARSSLSCAGRRRNGNPRRDLCYNTSFFCGVRKTKVRGNSITRALSAARSCATTIEYSRPW